MKIKINRRSSLIKEPSLSTLEHIATEVDSNYNPSPVKTKTLRAKSSYGSSERRQ